MPLPEPEFHQPYRRPTVEVVPPEAGSREQELNAEIMKKLTQSMGIPEEFMGPRITSELGPGRITTTPFEQEYMNMPATSERRGLTGGGVFGNMSGQRNPREEERDHYQRTERHMEFVERNMERQQNQVHSDAIDQNALLELIMRELGLANDIAAAKVRMDCLQTGDMLMDHVERTRNPTVMARAEDEGLSQAMMDQLGGIREDLAEDRREREPTPFNLTPADLERQVEADREDTRERIREAQNDVIGRHGMDATRTIQSPAEIAQRERMADVSAVAEVAMDLESMGITPGELEDAVERIASAQSSGHPVCEEDLDIARRASGTEEVLVHLSSEAAEELIEEAEAAGVEVNLIGPEEVRDAMNTQEDWRQEHEG